MVGAKGTGKTVFLTVLAHLLRTAIPRRLDADIRLTGDAQPGKLSPHQWLDQHVTAIYGNRTLFGETDQTKDGHREPLVFEWRQERMLGRLRTSYLSFYDTAGEDLGSQRSTHDQDYLRSADALLLLLDPFMLPQLADQLPVPDNARLSNEATVDVLGRVTELLRSHQRRGKIRIPVAVAFAKMDAFFDLLGPDHALVRTPPEDPWYDETLGQQTHEQVRSLLHQWSADDVDRHLRHSYSTFRYFAVSALGTPPDYDRGIVDPGGVQPHRVTEPLLWLLSQFNVVPSRGRR